MAVRRPVILDAGKLRELPTGDTLPGAGGGTTPTVLEVDFGYPAARSKTTTVAVPGITPASRVMIHQIGGPVTGKGSDEAAAEPLQASAIPSTNTLRITATAETGRFGGRTLLAYLIG